MTTQITPGCLLVATPLLLDPHFYQAIVLIVSHHAQGSVGLILNRPNALTLGEGLGFACPEALKNHFLFSGGPVEPESFFCLHNNNYQKNYNDTESKGIGHFEKSQELIPGVFIGSETDVLDAFAFDNPGKEFKARFFNGYAGWGPEQIDHEMSEGSWIIKKASPHLIFRENTTDLWEVLMSETFFSLSRFHQQRFIKYN